MGVGGRGDDPYENPRADLEERKTDYLFAITSSVDDDGPAKRRGYLRRLPDRPNPAPSRLGQLNRDLKRKTESYLTETKPPETFVASYEYQYLGGEDINMSLAHLVSGGLSPIPRVFPAWSARTRAGNGPIAIPARNAGPNGRTPLDNASEH